MIEVEEIGGTNVVYFKKVEANVTRWPLTFVRGINQDAGHKRHPSNGVGKTLLWSIPSNVWFAAPPHALKKRSKKELLSGKNSMGFVSFRANDGSHYRIEQKASGYKIIKDGEDMKIRTVPLAEAKIREIFPLREIHYYTYGFVSTQKPYPFQYASDAERLTNLVQMFDLDMFEPLRKHFAKQLSELKEGSVKAAVIRERLQSAKQARKGLGYDTARYEELTALISEADKQRAEVEQKIYKAEESARVMSQLLELEKELDTLRDEYRHKGTNPKRMLERLRDEQKLVTRYSSFLEKTEDYEQRKAKLTARLSKLKTPRHSRKDLVKEQKELRDEYEQVGKRLRSASSAASNYERLNSRIKKIELPDPIPEFPADLEERLSKARTQLMMKDLLEHAESGTCPTCRQTVDIQAVRRVIKAAEREIVELKELKLVRERVQERRALVKERKALDFDPEKLKRLEERHTEIAARLSGIQSELELFERIESIQSDLAELQRPEFRGEKPSLGLSLKQIEKDQRQCSRIIELLARKKGLTTERIRTAAEAKAQLKLLRISIEERKEQQAQLLRKSSKAAGELEALVQQKARIEHLDHDIEELTSKYRALKADPVKQRALEGLVRAYGPKGLRTQRADEICGLIESNLNYYRDLTFYEPFSFSMKASETGLSIMVDRGSGHVSDVRNLSGAEANAFRLLFTISVLPLIPPSRRLNFIVLDEPTSHMSEENRALIMERYIPVLKEAVPHVFFVTNNRDEYAPDSGSWLIVKKNKSSTLVDGASKTVNSNK